MPVLSALPPLFHADQGQASMQTRRWTERPLPCPRCQSHDMGRWGPYPYRPGGKRSGCPRAASAPATTSPLPGGPSARGRGRPGSLPPFWSAAPVPRGVWPGQWGALGVPARAGAGGGARPPWPMRWSAQERGRWQPMPSPPRLATRGKRPAGARRRWGAARVVVGRHVRPVEARMTAPGRRVAPGAAGRALSSSRRPARAPCRRCRRRPTSRCTRAVGSPRTRPAAPGRCRAPCPRSASTRRRHTRVVTCMSSARRACFPCSRRSGAWCAA